MPKPATTGPIAACQRGGPTCAGCNPLRNLVHGTSEASPFASLTSIYTLSDDALLAAINGHPLYVGWPEYDNDPDAAMLGPSKGMPA